MRGASPLAGWGRCGGGGGRSQGAWWPQGWAGDISLPTPICAVGETEARAGFPSGLGHQRAPCTLGVCRWAPRHTQSKAQQGYAGRHTRMHTHARSRAHSHVHPRRPTLLSPRRWPWTLAACLQRAEAGEPLTAPSTSPGSGSPACPHPPLPGPGPPRGVQQTQEKLGLQHPKEGSWGSGHRSDAPRLGNTGLWV